MRPNDSSQPTDPGTLAEVTTAAADILTAPPRRRAALTYLRQRGIDATVLPASWPLGYAPPGWTRLVDHLRPEFPDQVLLDAGLARRSSRGTLIDTFRDRVIFPLHDADGRVAGFLGRDLSGHPDAPKYLNTHQSAIFDKARLLYGMHETRAAIPHARQPVIVEGPLDVLAIATRTLATGHADLLPVAACGTAFTSAHARSVADAAFDHHAPVVLALDADPAGRDATLRAGEQLRALGVDVRVAALPYGSDPASYLTQPGNRLDPFNPTHAIPLLTVYVERAIAAQGDKMQWVEGRLAAGRAVAAHLATYPVSHAAAQIGWIADVLRLDATTFTFELAAAYRTPQNPSVDSGGDHKSSVSRATVSL